MGLPKKFWKFKRNSNIETVVTVRDAINKYGHDEDYKPVAECEPDDNLPGSTARIEALSRRVEAGQPIWHQDDRRTFDWS